jgi:membrane protease YdiL (CAAX protease family)
MLRWRVHAVWYGAAIGIPLLVAWSSRISDHYLFPGQPTAEAPAFLHRLAFAAAVNPWEELGWRAFALPRLRKRCNLLKASAVLGALVGVWHVPLFLWAGSQMSHYSFPVWFAGCFALCFLYSWIFVKTQNSALVTTICHISVNTLSPLFRSSVAGWSFAMTIVASVVMICSAPLFLSRQKRGNDRIA